MSDRYTDKPFLRFVDAWVLKAIGHLDDATDAYCKAMVPQLEQSFGRKGSWEQIVEQQMKFGPELPAQIRKIWTDGKARFAEGNGAAPDPVQFAMIFVDRNLGRACPQPAPRDAGAFREGQCAPWRQCPHRRAA